ncbi:MAG: hypothetical protein H6850_00800 [Alphaproteobacteria bacterium]|nr:MAG: hypothetical protein H6850_00800 [Alphaproteobacteria bacterium]
MLLLLFTSNEPTAEMPGGVPGNLPPGTYNGPTTEGTDSGAVYTKLDIKYPMGSHLKPYFHDSEQEKVGQAYETFKINTDTRDIRGAIGDATALDEQLHAIMGKPDTDATITPVSARHALKKIRGMSVVMEKITAYQTKTDKDARQHNSDAPALKILEPLERVLIILSKEQVDHFAASARNGAQEEFKTKLREIFAKRLDQPSDRDLNFLRALVDQTAATSMTSAQTDTFRQILQTFAQQPNVFDSASPALQSLDAQYVESLADSTNPAEKALYLLSPERKPKPQGDSAGSSCCVVA